MPPGMQAGDLPYVRELIEVIFLNLDFVDLMRVRRVCRFWRQTITGAPSLQRILFKRAETTRKENYGFSRAIEDYHGPLDPEISRAINDWQFALRRFLDQPPTQDTLGVLDHANGSVAMHLVRTDRFAAGWPIDILDMFCQPCGSFHNIILEAHLHPLFRHFKPHLVCFRSWGFRLIITAALQRWDFFLHRPSVTFIRNSLDQTLDVYDTLRNIVHTMRAYGLEADMLTRPLCSRLIVTNTITLQVEEHHQGVTVGQGATLMVKLCHESLTSLRNTVVEGRAREDPEGKEIDRCTILGEIDRVLTLVKALL
ncbi:hypothetical protein BU26DRAFT_607350 [Trematosphaeria pertusa]|uniref:F-box domain-containing protein n=1 Tax=Trematosphaeria pertusa TaxID=390896 RepID=A0A6A6I7Z1_9PLEO|nr:uncharacterized protein BU26DRAFT_607350 [Trematosphaeria pertusa]KAF2246082.1 hypothetical protein BU26DRAFT_607350 [Trematosphaeria pertusa]